MTEQYRCVWKDKNYGRSCVVIRRTDTRSVIVKFIDNGETASVHQMSLRMIKENSNAKK